MEPIRVGTGDTRAFSILVQRYILQTEPHYRRASAHAECLVLSGPSIPGLMGEDVNAEQNVHIGLVDFPTTLRHTPLKSRTSHWRPASHRSESASGSYLEDSIATPRGKGLSAERSTKIFDKLSSPDSFCGVYKRRYALDMKWWVCLHRKAISMQMVDYVCTNYVVPGRGKSCISTKRSRLN